MNAIVGEEDLRRSALVCAALALSIHPAGWPGQRPIPQVQASTCKRSTAERREDSGSAAPTRAGEKWLLGHCPKADGGGAVPHGCCGAVVTAHRLPARWTGAWGWPSATRNSQCSNKRNWPAAARHGRVDPTPSAAVVHATFENWHFWCEARPPSVAPAIAVWLSDPLRGGAP